MPRGCSTLYPRVFEDHPQQPKPGLNAIVVVVDHSVCVGHAPGIDIIVVIDITRCTSREHVVRSFFRCMVWRRRAAVLGRTNTVAHGTRETGVRRGASFAVTAITRGVAVGVAIAGFGIETDSVQVAVLIILREVRLLSLEKSFQVALSFRLLCTALELDKVRDSDHRQDTNNRNHDHQLDKSKAFFLHDFRSFLWT